MKYIFICTSLFILLLSAPTNIFGQSTKRVLFIGNSYTSVNNLPQMISDVAISAGNILIFDSNTPGGYYLTDHLINTVSINKITTGNWDYVVLQDQSLAYSNGSPYLPSAYKLDTIIKSHNSCAQTMFYITWGRKNGAIYFCQPPECDSIGYINKTYYEMDQLIERNYMFAADSLKALASPVGAVWRNIRQNYPSIELFQPDESHPSEAGTYAAACCFYATIFRKDPTLIAFNSTIPASDAAIIRNAVKLIVYDSLLNWHIGEYDTLMNSDCFATGIEENSRNIFWDILPNPVTEILTIKFTNSCLDSNCNEDYIQIYNAIGSLISEKQALKTTQLDVANLATGLYFIRLKNNINQTLKFIKQ